jgi:hypothetical protein
VAEESTTHGANTVLAANVIHDLLYPEQVRDASTVLDNVSFRGSVGSSGITPVATLDLERRSSIQQRIISAQQRIIDDQNQEILRLQQLVYSLSQESDEDLELDYSSMEAQARLRAPSGVNWKVASTPKSYSEIMDVRYDPDAEER